MKNHETFVKESRKSVDAALADMVKGVALSAVGTVLMTTYLHSIIGDPEWNMNWKYSLTGMTGSAFLGPGLGYLSCGFGDLYSSIHRLHNKLLSACDVDKGEQR